MSDPERRDPQQNSTDWIERIVGIATALGFNPVRLRWKLRRWHNTWRSWQRRQERRVAQIRYRHKTCSTCGALNDHAERACTKCGARLGGRARQMLARVGLTAPKTTSVSALLGGAFVLVYARVLIAAGVGSLFALSGPLLVEFGGHYPPYLEQGQWWRWLTAIYLHGGLWHIAFNMYALTVIGPHVEQLYGRWPMLGLFVLTGVLANIGSWLAGLHGVGIGASGGIMGLIGLAVGWGQRSATSAGRTLRNDMLKWCAYVFVFGWLVGADNWAHFFGLAAGAAIGFGIRPEALRRGAGLALARATAATGIVASVAALTLILFAHALISAPI